MGTSALLGKWSGGRQVDGQVFKYVVQILAVLMVVCNACIRMQWLCIILLDKGLKDFKNNLATTTLEVTMYTTFLLGPARHLSY